MNTLTGKVIDHITQAPISEASVMLQKKDGPSMDIAQMTDDNGKFIWYDMVAGDYNIHVFADDYENHTVQTVIGLDEMVVVVIDLRKT